MAVNIKPTLYNGYIVKEDLIIKNRVEKIYFTEVYETTNKKYLYLLLNINPNEIVINRNKHELIRVKVEKDEYIGVLVEEHSNNLLATIIQDLTTLKGLDCVAGMKELKQQLISDVINPLTNPEKFQKFKVSIPNGIILYGPPGCGKTFIVRKLAEELGYNYFEVKHSDLATPYIHGSVGNIGKAFSVAKQNAPAILFFDEISGLVPDRKNLHETSSHKEEEVNEFLIQLNDAADNSILVVGATNYIERIDPAVLRPGRFDKKIYVSKPDYEARKELFKLGLEGRPYDSNIDFGYLANITNEYSCADLIEGVVETAARSAANLDKKEIDQALIEAAINQTNINKVF